MKTDREEYLRNYRQWYFQNITKRDPEYKRKYTEATYRWRDKRPIKYLLQKARTNAKWTNKEFNISEEDINIPDVCPALKVPFKFGTPYAPSIDRIDSSKGYVKGNAQILSRKANLMKNDATPEELKKFAEWVNQSTI